MIKKIGAAILAVVLLTMCMTAFASEATTTLENNGEQGAFKNPDSPVIQGKVLKIEKELKVYNLNEAKVYAPTITYSYAITAGSAGKNVTDAATKHNPEGTVTVPTKAGIVDNIPAIADVTFTTSDKLDATTNGASNKKSISIDFSNVVFDGAGIYRYKLTESLASDFTYANTGVTETTGTHDRYIDVYVKPADNFTTGSKPTDWDIYGFTCFYNDEDITDADKTTKAVKTTGFVDGTKDGSTAFLADQYYTYNLEISKKVEGDNYAKVNHSFPFTVIFTNGDVTKNILLDAKVGSGVTAYEFLTTAGKPTYSGVLLIKDVDDNNSIKLIGIPMGTDVEVYETNDMLGTTYKVTTTWTNDTTETNVDAMVISGTKPANAVAQPTEKPADQSTKSVIDTTKNADDDIEHKIEIKNTLVTISPTGVVLRIAPYVMILAAGIFLLLISRRRKAAED